MRLTHSELGDIEFNNGWVKYIGLNIFGRDCSVEVNIDADEDAEFDENQILAYKEFFKSLDDRVSQAESKIVDYYNSIIDDIIAGFTEELKKREFIEARGNQSKIFEMITAKQILIPINFDDDTREAGFICDCEWDLENGVGIKYINEQIDEIGYQDILL